VPFSSVLSFSSRRLVLGVLLALLCGSPAGTSLAQPDVADSVRQAALEDFHGPDLAGKDGPLAKAGLDLLLLYHQRHSGADRSSSIRSEDEPTGASRGGLQIQNGRVVIDAIAAGDVAALAADLDSLGMTDGATAGGLVSGRFPIGKIPALAHLETLRGVQPARARTRSGSSAETTTPTRPSQPTPADRPGPSEDTASPSEEAPPDDTPPPDDESASAAPEASPDGDPPSSATTSSPFPGASSPPPEETASSDVPPEDASMAIWGLLALMAIVLFLEER